MTIIHKIGAVFFFPIFLFIVVAVALAPAETSDYSTGRALQEIAEAEAKAKAEADLKSIKFVKKTKVEPEKPKGRDMEGCGGDLYFKDQLNIWWVMLKEGGGGALNGPWKAKVQQVSDQKFGGWWKFCDVGGYQYAID